MFTLTFFLLALIGLLGSANALLWTGGKKNKRPNTGFETTFLENQKTGNLQDNDSLAETSELKNWPKDIYSRVNALEEAAIQIQNELNEISALKNAEPLYTKKEKFPKNSRVQILEEYLKKI